MSRLELRDKLRIMIYSHGKREKKKREFRVDFLCYYYLFSMHVNY